MRHYGWDVPLAARGIAGLDSQGIAHTLAASELIEMPVECARRGEVMSPSGQCVPMRVDGQAKPASTQMSASASSAVRKVSTTTMVIAGIAVVGLIYVLGKR